MTTGNANVILVGGRGGGAQLSATVIGGTITAINSIESAPSQLCAVSYPNKTSSSFDITLIPMDGERFTIGTVDVKVMCARGVV